MPALNQKEAEQIASYLDLPCVEPPNAEIALVFGARLQLLYAAVDLLRRGVLYRADMRTH